jgi:hypothetical protein
MACNGHVITCHYMHYMPLHVGQDANGIENKYLHDTDNLKQYLSLLVCHGLVLSLYIGTQVHTTQKALVGPDRVSSDKLTTSRRRICASSKATASCLAAANRTRLMLPEIP